MFGVDVCGWCRGREGGGGGRGGGRRGGGGGGGKQNVSNEVDGE